VSIANPCNTTDTYETDITLESEVEVVSTFGNSDLSKEEESHL